MIVAARTRSERGTPAWSVRRLEIILLCAGVKK